MTSDSILRQIDQLVIEMLEEDTRLDELTRIVLIVEIEEDGLAVLESRGAQNLRFGDDEAYVRPMFQVMPPSDSGHPVYYQDPCPACYDFARSWNCPEHPEGGPEVGMIAKPIQSARLAFLRG